MRALVSAAARGSCVGAQRVNHGGRIRRPVIHGSGEEFEPECRDTAATANRVLHIPFGGRLRRFRRQLHDGLAGRDPAAARKRLRGGWQHLVVTRVAAAFFHERRARLFE